MTDQPDTPEKGLSRYARVKHILDDADNGSAAQYNGAGKFWQLPLEAFKQVEVAGVRMIAPAEENAITANAPAPHDYQKLVTARRRPADLRRDVRSTSAGSPTEGSCCGSKKAENPAPAKKESSCCGSTPEAAPAPESHQPGRGDASGLIRGLRGQWPFDNTHYPQLMWGGKTVAESDIRFISQWIDDGCPGDDYAESNKGQENTSDTYKLATGADSIKASNANLNDWQSGQGGLKMRKNAENLTPDELANLRYAFGELMKLNEYPNDKRSYHSWAQIHGDTCQHGWEQFLPWHRAYLYTFEQALQDIHPSVTLPYWDWTYPAYNEGRVQPDEKCGTIPTPYRGMISKSLISQMESQGMPAEYLDNLKKNQGKDFNSSTSLYRGAGLTYSQTDKPANETVYEWRNKLDTALVAENPLYHRLRYPAQFYKSDGTQVMDDELAQFHHHYPRAEDIEQIMQLGRWRDFGGGHVANQSFGVLSMNPHNTGHIWSGGANPDTFTGFTNEPANGDMFNDLFAAYDPIFWGHHSNVDRMWAQWQERHPDVNPSDLSDVMVPFYFTVRDMLDYHKLGYDYVSDAHFFQTSGIRNLQKMNSQQVGVKSSVLKKHQRAEVMIHGLERQVDSLFIYVFLNHPEASPESALKATNGQAHKHLVGSFATFGHGPCIGGEGHCDPRGLLARRPFDFRGRDHNSVSNIRLDATETVKEIAAEMNGAAEKDISVQVVAMTPAGEYYEKGIHMDGVSLRFFD
ncbi:tyrosinase family protein [Roseivirga sp. BDSF3-8]|uniref:tyrosinase family protein n=1 Tax=Roseivirga sp. BDSF3-8 TaxID=3241598 RepID=UPI003531EF4F